MTSDPAQLWAFLPWGYLLSVTLETPVLLVGLSPRHPLARRFFCGFWLTACTYPIVILVLTQLILRPIGESGESLYLVVAETFAPVAECLLFWLAYDAGRASTISRGELVRDMLAIVAANLTSYSLGWVILVTWQRVAT
jgi:hypothetical protein